MSPTPEQYTKEKLAGFIAEQLKTLTGKSAEEWKEFQAYLKSIQDGNDVVRRQNMAGLVAETMPASYAASAQSFMRTDPHKGIGLKMGALVRAHFIAKVESRNVKDVAAKDLSYKWLADDIDHAEQMRIKSPLSASLFGSGGAVVPPSYSEEIIELLRAMAVCRKSGIREMPMPNGTLVIPRQASAATATYSGELANIAASYLTLEQINMAMHKLTSLSVISNDLIKVSSPQIDAIVRDDLVMVMALKEDLQFLRGDGTQFGPKGMLSRINSSNQFARTAAPTLTTITNDLFQAMSQPSQNNVPTVRPAWFMHKKTEIGIRRLRDSVGQLVFNDEMMRGSLLGVPFYVSNQIPTNLGSGSNKSEVYYLETSQAIIGDTYQMEVAVFPNGSYHDGSVVQSGISQDASVIRAVSAHDFALRHDLVGSVINTVDWGN